MTELKFALSIEEAADYTGIGRNTLRNLVEWEKLPILRVGRKILIRRERLDEFLILNEGWTRRRASRPSYNSHRYSREFFRLLSSCRRRYAP